MSQDSKKQIAAQAAITHIKYDMTVGIGTGTTVNDFIDALAKIKGKIKACVPSSNESRQRLQSHGIEVIDLNTVDTLDVYIDGADEVNPHRMMIKGGGAALTGEKIVAAVAKKFICIVDDSKVVDVLGQFPLPIAVIPMARSYVAREIVKLGGIPTYREGVKTDEGHVILDVQNFNIIDPISLEQKINHITGVVTNGIFAARPADLVLVGTDEGVQSF